METSKTSDDGGRFFHVNEMTVRFGGITAIKNLSIEIKKNEIRGLIGPNGAGKTTFFNAISRYVPLVSGNIFFQGQDITALKPHQVAKIGIIRTFQKRGIIASLTALENVMTGAHRLMEGVHLWDIGLRLKKFRKAEEEGYHEAVEVLEAVGLHDVAGKGADELSFGQQTLVEIARALVSKPKLLLLDEPAAGLGDTEREQVMEVLKSLPSKHGVSLIITDHIIDFVMKICENLTVLNFGEKLEEGSVSYIRNHPGVLDAYFGIG